MDQRGATEPRRRAKPRRPPRWTPARVRGVRVTGAVALTALLLGCGGPLDLELVLRAAVRPDPFAGVSRVRVVGLVQGEAIELDSVRWDQGPVVLPGRLPLEATRVWVEGLGPDGELRSVGSSARLDLLTAAVSRLELAFLPVGTLSELSPEPVVPRRRGWRAASLGEDGVLLLGGARPDGATPSSTVRITPSGQVLPGPELEGGRVGAAVVSVGGQAVVWGGRSDGGTRPAPTWAVLDGQRVTAAGPNPIPPGSAPVAVAAGARRVTVVDRESAAVGELDVADGRGRRVGALDATAPGSAFADLGGGRLLVVGGEGLASAAVFDTLSGRFVGPPVPLLGPRVEAGVVATGAGSAVVGGGAGRRRWVSLRVPDGSSTATVSAFATEPAASPGAPALGPARVWDAGGGVLLAAPRTASGRALRVELSPPRVVPLAVPPVPFDLAPFVDGSLRGVRDDGVLVGFAPGPGGFAPRLGPRARGLVPDRPERWSVDERGVVGTLPTGETSTVLVLGEAAPARFVLDVRVEPRGRGRAELRFDIAGGSYERIRLERSATLRSGPGRPRRGCAIADAPALDEGAGPVEIRLERGPQPGDESATRVRLDVGRDGRFELECRYEGATVGRVGLAVASGAVRFAGLRYRWWSEAGGR